MLFFFLIRYIKALSIPIKEKGVNMKNALLAIFLLLNVVFVIYFLGDKSIVGLQFASLICAIYFVFSIIYSLFFIIKYKKYSNLNLLLSFGVLSTSVGSFAIFGFFYMFYHAMG